MATSLCQAASWHLLVLAALLPTTSGHGHMTKAVKRDTGETVCAYSNDPDWHCEPTNGVRFRKTVSGDRWPPTHGSQDCHFSPGCELECERRHITHLETGFKCTASTKCNEDCTTNNQCDWCPLEIVNDRQPFPGYRPGPYGHNPAAHWDHPKAQLQQACASRESFGAQGVLNVKAGEAIDITQFMSVDHSSIYRFELVCGRNPSSADFVSSPVSPWMAQVRFRNGKSNNGATIGQDRIIGYTKADTNRYFESMSCAGWRCDNDPSPDTWRISWYPRVFRDCQGHLDECSFTDTVTIPRSTDCSGSGGHAVLRWSMLSAESYEVYGHCLDLKVQASPSAPFQCSDLETMTDVRTLTPKQWCWNGLRGTNAQACNSAYVTRADGTQSLCKYNTARRRCELESVRHNCGGVLTSPPPSPPPPSPPPARTSFSCSALTNMLDVRTLSPAEWCGTAYERRAERSKCEAAYVTREDGSVSPCKYTAPSKPNSAGICSMNSLRLQCSFEPGFDCSRLSSMYNVRALSPPEWCGSPSRSTASACHEAYVQNGAGKIRLCKFNSGVCELDRSIAPFTC